MNAAPYTPCVQHTHTHNTHNTRYTVTVDTIMLNITSVATKSRDLYFKELRYMYVDLYIAYTVEPPIKDTSE